MTPRTRLPGEASGRPFQSYQILFLLEKETSIRIGALGRFLFPAGLYVYTGSARKHIEARIRRHLAESRRNRWHIDYLLSHPFTHVVSTKRSSLDECVLNQRTTGRVIVRRLGASDCTRHCKSHLKFVGKNLRTLATAQKLR